MENTEKKKLSPKRRLIILIGALVALLATVSITLLILLPDGDKPLPKLPPRAEGEFAPVDWEEDITLDEEYMALDRTVRYKHENGVTYTLTDADHNDGGAQASFIYEVLCSIRDGDSAAYNAALSEYYRDAVGEKLAFTPQKLYDIYFEIYAVEDGGELGPLFTYHVYYRIKDNNGTFRDDVLSDECRRVSYHVRATASGWEIYTVTYQLLS